MTIKFLKKAKKKKTILGPFLVLFIWIWAKRNCPGKKFSRSVFKYSNYLSLRQKSEKLFSHSWEKCHTDGWKGRQMDRQTDGQADNSDFVGSFIGWGSIIKVTFSFLEFIPTHAKPVYSINLKTKYKKAISSHFSHGIKTFIETSCDNNTHTGENVFLQLLLFRVWQLYLFR